MTLKETIEDYKNFSLNADKKNRAMTIKYTYPFLSTGVINSLVQTGANNDQVKQAAVEQIQINAAKNKNFTKTPPESIKDSKIFLLIARGLVVCLDPKNISPL